MGRVKEFDRDHVLHQAMLVFWRKGYEATSIPDLLAAMKLSRSSLYETFTDKETLYVEAIEHYKRTSQSKRDLLTNATSAREGIRAYFERHIAAAFDEALPGGCLVTNAATDMDSPDEQVRKLIQDRFESLERAFYELLERGQQAGEIDSSKDVRFLALLLLNLNHSINVIAKVNKDKARIVDMMDKVIEML